MDTLKCQHYVGELVGCDGTNYNDQTSANITFDDTTSADTTYEPKTTARKGLLKEFLKWYDDTTNEDTPQFQAQKGSRSKNCHASAHTWACIGNKTFGIRKPTNGIVADQDSKGKRKVGTGRKVADQVKNEKV
ncbi:hypothetical protein Tco_0316426 [Tanacetum coccineum]